MYEQLEGEHLILRKAKEGDYRSMLKHVWGDPDVYGWMLFQPTFTGEDAIERCKRSIEFQKEHYAWFIADKATDEAFGLCAVKETAPGHFEESGIAIGTKYQGKGCGKEVVALLLDLAFNKLGAKDFRYGYYQDNLRSKKVAEAFGFEYTHTYEMTRPWDGALKVIDSCLLTREKYMRMTGNGVNLTDNRKGKMQMKTIETNGITYIEPVPGATNEWYFGVDYEHGDLYEAEELFRDGKPVNGRNLCLVHYPDGEVFFPVPKNKGHYSETPVYFEGGIYIIDVDFPQGQIRIMRFDCEDHSVCVHAEIPLSAVKDCYNLQLHISPLTLSRQYDNTLEIIWPEKLSISMGDHDSFFLRDGEKLYFNRWYEEGDSADYKYREETIVRNLAGDVTETLTGDVMLMGNGEMWNLR